MLPNINKGSEWRKWDLHVHTKGTAKNDQFKSSTFSDCCDILFKKALDKNISAIGITDYFNIDNYKEAVQYRDNIDTSTYFTDEEKTRIKNILILPNVELRMLPSTDKGKLVNIHCIFNPAFINDVENDFFGSIEYSAGPKTKYKMNRKGLIDLGKSIDHTLSDQDAYFKGINTFVVSNADLQNLLDSNSNFRKNVLIVISNSNHDGVSGFQKHYDFFEDDTDSSLDGVRRAMYKISDCIFSGNPEDRKYFLGQKKDDIEVVIKKCGSLKPCVHGSDAHTEEELFSPDKERFCWIKADLTFEGLKQIIFEPELRVRIQESDPNQKIPYQVIEEVRFVATNNVEFTSKRIGLNPDLNIIIGGKSSGKSLLLYCIANTMDAEQTYSKEEKRTDDKYGIKKRGIDFEVKWANSTTKLLSANNDTNSLNYPLLYIPQNYIQTLADTEGKKTRKEVGKIIRQILLQKAEYKSVYSQFLVEVRRLDVIRESIISQYINALNEYNSAVSNVKNIGDKNAILKFIGEKKTQAEELQKNSNVSEQEQKEYEAHTDILQKSNKQLFDLNSDRQKISAFNYNLQKTISGLISSKALLLQELKNDEIQSKMSTDLAQLDTLASLPQNLQLSYLDDFLGMIAVNEDNIKQHIEKEKSSIEPISKKFLHRGDIETIESLILLELDKINVINKYEEDIKIKREQKDSFKRELLKEYTKTYQQYIEVVSKLNESGQEIKNITLTGSCKFYIKRFYDRFREFINNTSTSAELYMNSAFPEEKTIVDVVNIEQLTIWLGTVFDRVVDGRIVLKSRFTIKDILNALFKDDFFDYWEVKANNDEIAIMSPGKASLVLLKLLIDLSDSKAPILIDQPEDNLDNRSIYSDLVKYIRSKKNDRQFIVVTHNPNILVGADAENVIIANQNDQDEERKNENYQFDYINGALEDTKERSDDHNILTSMGIREHVTEILEGGKEAFLKRESKYGYA